MRFENPAHILIIGKLPPVTDRNSFELINEFYEGLELFDYFSGQNFSSRDLKDVLNDGFDFLAIYDPDKDQVIDWLLSGRLEYWLEVVSAVKPKPDLIARLRFKKTFFGKESQKTIFNQIILGV